MSEPDPIYCTRSNFNYLEGLVDIKVNCSNENSKLISRINDCKFGRAASEYSCSGGSMVGIISDSSDASNLDSLSPIKNVELSVSEVSTISSARSNKTDKLQRGRSPSLSYTTTSLIDKRNGCLLRSNSNRVVKNMDNKSTSTLLISQNDRMPASVVSRKKAKDSPRKFQGSMILFNKLSSSNSFNDQSSQDEKIRSSICFFTEICSCMGFRVKNVNY
ncbi:uncharacterized protein CMU_035730 [Cryptosporidium muris RN66]|uniref:Uncharacterized protein n=1 Tax=Cryptosporidium muris (strain RN66) TaxID=441375 RepID=B6AGQ9_CRYMR|nr:uncharacterized protein CMU_035730 [Cryptosporidium muris RN66]EEA07400.1 hypothetical protein, conserved [Cryptosporidium muris RN66]|eukprot:XP_002141749.1 hypothetical protein [Cryptosporidium muris RN66]